MVVGAQRTDQQDVQFGLRQLADISAPRAPPPARTTRRRAVHALDHVSAVLCRLCDRALEFAVWRDDDDRPRLYARRRGLRLGRRDRARSDAALRGLPSRPSWSG